MTTRIILRIKAISRCHSRSAAREDISSKAPCALRVRLIPCHALPNVAAITLEADAVRGNCFPLGQE